MENEQQQSTFSKILSQLPRLLFTYVTVSLITGSIKQSFQPTQTTEIQQQQSSSPYVILPSWQTGQSMDLYFYLDSNEEFQDFGNKDKLFFKESGLTYGRFSDEIKKEFTIPCTTQLQNNGSLYGHFYLAKSGFDLVDTSSSNVVYHRKALTRYMLKKKVIKKKHLTKDDNEDKAEEIEPAVRPIVSYWWPNVTLQVVPSETPLSTFNQPNLAKMLQLDNDGRHLPIFYSNDFWMLQENLMPINDTVKELKLSFTFSELAYWKFTMLTQFTESFRVQTDVMGADPAEIDQIKRMFIDTNPYLLAITMIVSILHSIFDFLAFKNDIKFWKNKKNMEGLSFRTIILNVFFQFIVFLYLIDNDTSYLVCVSNGVGLLIEIWKINKTVIIKRKPTFPYIDFVNRVKPSKLVTKTQEYDKMAFKYLSYVLFPLMAAYTVYSMFYEKHKSWYSFVLGTLVGFVYTFGFISMTPQLFINYKLKSVAHMPWKTFMYKALNTFIDDLFAFVIKMPWLHRLSCLRDDFIFFIYLYQRYIYPEDKRRVNEFGQVGEEVEGEESEEDDEASRVTDKETEEIKPLPAAKDSVKLKQRKPKNKASSQ